MERLRSLGLWSLALWLCLILLGATVGTRALATGTRQVQRVIYSASGKYLIVEVLDDHLVHFELSAKAAPRIDLPLATSPMVARVQYPGPKTFSRSGSQDTVIDTSVLTLTVDPVTLCLSAFDKVRQTALTRICPMNLEQDWKGLSLSPERMRNLYGLGQEYRDPGVMDGDWMGRVRHPGEINGNRMEPFNGGWDGNTQIPVLYALGEQNHNYAFFLDSVYKQEWDFTANPWKVQQWGDQIRWYLMAGPSLASLRHSYMDLVGRPPVPPKKLFGLWISEYGYRDWAELEKKLASLRDHHFPVDGFMLDLFWFGGVTSDSDDSKMGVVSWDLDHFKGLHGGSSPKDELTWLREQQGIGIIPIEESYVCKNLPEHQQLKSQGYLVKDGSGEPAYLTDNPWWGRGGLLDWTNAKAAEYWHQQKRLPLILDGVMGHWVDLGEPEMYPRGGRYAGGSEADVHNIFNLKWIEGIFRGYQKFTPEKRPFMLSRSGAAGMQRYGAGMWSGDIGSDLANLAAHQNAQMHMSLSGIDYYGADIGGFHREALKGDLDEMYTQWFASGMLFDIPGRPHTENLSHAKETAPDRIGDVASNLDNLRQRYALIPYVYSLAHQAHLKGEPVFPPPFYYFQDDLNLRYLAHQKMIGPSLMAASVAHHGQMRTDVYLPQGRWIEFHEDQWITSQGDLVTGVPLYPHGKYLLPLYARAGALIPMMFVDEKTMNVFGKRTDGTRRDELVVRVYPDASESKFTLFEDDGESTGYLGGQVRTTLLSQRLQSGMVSVTIASANSSGNYRLDETRNNVVELVLEKPSVSSVRLNGADLTKAPSIEAWNAADAGWFFAGGGRVLIKSGILPVNQAKEITVSL